MTARTIFLVDLKVWCAALQTYYPLYYNMFSCIADKCSDSCCKDWEIVIDNETYKKYLDLSDEFGERIKSCVSADEDGVKCFSLIGGKCPFLDEKGLCEIHIKLGEHMTSRICRNHPRFIEEYDGFTEISLSLSCPKAAEIIFTSEINSETYPSPEYKGCDDALERLIESRKRLLDFNNDFSLLYLKIFDTAAEDQFVFDLTHIEKHPFIVIDFINEYLSVLLEACDILTDEWEKMLEKALSCDEGIEELRAFIIRNNEKICKLCKYYIYRYYLKAINDLDVYSRGLFIVMSCIISAAIALANKIPLEEAARLYSKEIEHNTDNINMILDYFFEL